MINWEVVFWTCMTMVVVIGVVAIVVSVISAFNVRKRREELQEVHTELAVGRRILCCGGIYGRVVGFEGEENVNVEIAKGTIITISRYAIQTVYK
ncbi:MAG: preprotein translocase subunit YajC [Lachnospiraceae bacterium]